MASVTLLKARNLFRREGFWKGIGRAWARGTGAVRVYRVGQTRGRIENTGQLVDLAMDVGGGFIRPMQVRSEIVGLLDRVKAIRPKVVLEIGTANGGTLMMYCHVAADDAHLVSVDLPAGAYGDGYPVWKGPIYRSFALKGQRVSLLRGDSHSRAMLEDVRETLGGQAVDFLFIDGDHTYEGVRQDFEMYAPLVREGGLVAFHDIAIPPDGEGYGTRKFWEEIRGPYDGTELIERPADQRGYGIGVLTWRGRRT